MDSLTQITLGAATGEAVLGKKIGNRALLWGALAGTLPDLDVLSNMTSDPLSALAFHRAITHSLAFGMIMPIGLAWLAYRLYRHGKDSLAFFKDLGIFFLGTIATIFLGALDMDIPREMLLATAATIGLVTLIFPIILHLREKYRKHPSKNENPSFRDWILFFFVAVITHPILDSFTTYGTQLFRPFADTRVSFNNISVADPLYTLPFIFLLGVILFLKRTNRWRSRLNWLALGLSSSYMVLTFVHKAEVNDVFESTLAAKNVTYNRYITTPTIFNNVLWKCLAETDSTYYYGFYSILDKEPIVKNMTIIPKDHHLLNNHQNDRAVKTLQWFTNGYYNVMPVNDSTLQMNDLRFGTLGNSAKTREDFVFNFMLKNRNGILEMEERDPAESQPEDTGKALDDFWERIKGI